VVKRITEDSGRSLDRLYFSKNFMLFVNAVGYWWAQDTGSATMLGQDCVEKHIHCHESLTVDGIEAAAIDVWLKNSAWKYPSAQTGSQEERRLEENDQPLSYLANLNRVFNRDAVQLHPSSSTILIPP
jgi:hypothetical protein